MVLPTQASPQAQPIIDFLHTIITTPEGNFCLATLTREGLNWHEEWYTWPAQDAVIAARALELAPDYNVYFSSYLFSDHSTQHASTLPSRTIQADLDDASLLDCPIPPTYLVETSPNRHQAYWVLKQEYTTPTGDTPALPIAPVLPLPPDTHETLSRKLTYSIPNCDRSGWPLGRKLRVPYTLNHKYLDGPHPVVPLIGTPHQLHNAATIDLLPDIDDPIKVTLDTAFLEGTPPVPDTLLTPTGEVGPFELLESIKGKIPPRVYSTYSIRNKDRSAALWALMLAAFRAGLTRDAVFFLAWHSANNKFIDLRYNAERELAKDTLRAESLTASPTLSARENVLAMRKLPGLTAEKRSFLYDLVLDYMQKTGTFIRCSDDQAWFIRHDLGRPISISGRSDYLNMVLDLQFGLNSTEAEASYVVAGLNSYALALPITGTMAALSYYDADSHSIFLHTGHRDVIHITSTNITHQVNGFQGIVFPWNPSAESFDIRAVGSSAPALDYTALLFDEYMDNVIGDPAHARVLLQVWLLFLLLRSAAMSRPILAILGQPGSGKSTLFRKLYALIYGRSKSLSSITTPDDFDHAVSADPLTVLDNVDTWERWLPDRLALSVTPSDITRRKLYTDKDLVILKRQALLGLTAHNPRFGRPDVADRLLIINLQRLTHFASETAILNNILANRAGIWASITHDLQLILQTLQPASSAVPQLRVEDFARVGYWIATALNLGPIFTQAVQSLKVNQGSFAMDEDGALSSSISAYVNNNHQNGHSQFMPPQEVWNTLLRNAPDPTMFNRVYRNPVALSKKLFAMADSLSTAYDIEWRLDPATGTRMWRIGGKLDA